MKNILVLAPHADDEILGCGGTIARRAREGHQVFVAVMTNAHVGAPELFGAESIETVRDEARRAHQELGVHTTFFEDLPAPRLEQYPQYKIANAISKIVRETRAQVVYLPHKGDLHLDHAAIYNAGLVACRPLAGQSVREVYAYETLSETEWGHPTPEMSFIPNRFVELDESSLEQKLCAMACFKSQLREFPNPRSLRALRALAELRGSTVGAQAAEAFCVLRAID